MTNKEGLINWWESKLGSSINDTDLFLKGSYDCIKGVAHKDGKGSDYDRGYAAEYQHQQNLSRL